MFNWALSMTGNPPISVHMKKKIKKNKTTLSTLPPFFSSNVLILNRHICLGLIEVIYPLFEWWYYIVIWVSVLLSFLQYFFSFFLPLLKETPISYPLLLLFYRMEFDEIFTQSSLFPLWISYFVFWSLSVWRSIGACYQMGSRVSS